MAHSANLFVVVSRVATRQLETLAPLELSSNSVAIGISLIPDHAVMQCFLNPGGRSLAGAIPASRHLSASTEAAPEQRAHQRGIRLEHSAL